MPFLILTLLMVSFLKLGGGGRFAPASGMLAKPAFKGRGYCTLSAGWTAVGVRRAHATSYCVFLSSEAGHGGHLSVPSWKTMNPLRKVEKTPVWILPVFSSFPFLQQSGWEK